VNSALASKLELRKLAMQQHVSIIINLHRKNPPALRVFETARKQPVHDGLPCGWSRILKHKIVLCVYQNHVRVIRNRSIR
jgi:hypothetical protein